MVSPDPALSPIGASEQVWRDAVELARKHGVQSLFFRAVKENAQLHPDLADLPDLMADLPDLRAASLENTRRNLRMSGELLKVLNAFDVRGIAVLPFKGPTLAALAHGDLGLREFGDLDLWIEREDLHRGEDLLRGLGYTPQVELASAGEAILDAYGVIAFTNAASDCMVELHWDLAPRFLPFPANFSRMYERRIEVNVAGHPVPTMALEDLLVYLCHHGAKHWWESLGWIADVAWLVNRRAELDWRLLLDRARELRCERALSLGLLLARDLLNAKVPRWVEEWTQSDAVAVRLAALVHQWLISSFHPGTLERSRYYLALHSRIGDKLRCAYHLFVAPNVADWEFLPLPRPLAFLYPVVRIVRLLKER